ncbi:hypothetical protein AABB24_038501, partial [Solanum stoloniferum]
EISHSLSVGDRSHLYQISFQSVFIRLCFSITKRITLTYDILQASSFKFRQGHLDMNLHHKEETDTQQNREFNNFHRKQLCDNWLGPSVPNFLISAFVFEKSLERSKF